MSIERPGVSVKIEQQQDGLGRGRRGVEDVGDDTGSGDEMLGEFTTMTMSSLVLGYFRPSLR